MIFSEVVAVIATEYSQQLLPNIVASSIIIKRLQEETDVRCSKDDHSPIKGGCTIRGNLQQIVMAERLLQKCLAELNMETVTSEETNRVKTNSKDQSVLCDSPKSNQSSRFALEHPRKARKLDTVHVCNGKGTKTTSNQRNVTRFGRSQEAKLLVKDMETTATSTLQEMVFSEDTIPIDCQAFAESEAVQSSERSDKGGEHETMASSDTNPPMLSEHHKKKYEQMTPYKFLCKQCSFKTKRESHYMKHVLIHDRVKTLYNCDKCTFTTIRLSHLRRHYTSHSQSTYDCDWCPYKATEAKLLGRHVRLKHNEKAQDLSVVNGKVSSVEVLGCVQCPYKTTKKHHLKRHRRVHSTDWHRSVSSRVYECDQCKYKTSRKEHFVRHKNDVHGNERPYLCDLCGKAFKRSDALKQHCAVHGTADSHKGGLFKCVVCHKRCRSQALLNEHQAVHSTVRLFLCEICGASFKTRSVQRKHVLNIHKNPRSYCCAHCAKRFNTNYALRRHERLHKTEGMELPSECRKTTITDDQMQPEPEFLELDKHGLTTALLNCSQEIEIIAATESLHEDKKKATSDPVTIIEECFSNHKMDILEHVPQNFMDNEASTALLYLTTNFTQYS